MFILMTQLFLNYRYESTSQKLPAANLPVLGSNSNNSQDHQQSQILSPGSAERAKSEANQERLQHQQSASSQLERKLQQPSPVHRNDEDGPRRGSGIEEI